MTEAIYSAYALALFSPPVRAVRRMEKKKQAEHIQNRRANSPKELALLKAIVKCCTNSGLIARPAKEAAAILDGVNKELAKQGYPSAKVDVVRRRLEFFRVLEERTKS
jgi:hypothetical protein